MVGRMFGYTFPSTAIVDHMLFNDLTWFGKLVFSSIWFIFLLIQWSGIILIAPVSIAILIFGIVGWVIIKLLKAAIYK